MKVVISLILTLVAFLSRPNRAHCPVNRHVGRASRDGSFTCVLNPPMEKPSDGCWGGRSCPATTHDEEEVSSMIHCTNGLVVAQDGASVWCARVPQ